MVPVKINRGLPLGKYPVTKVFKDLDESPGLKRFIPARPKRLKFLESTHIEVVEEDTYMWTDDEDGHVNVGRKYLATGEDVYLYMDILHELVHVRQFKEGKELFDTKYEYVERPTEVEAYAFAVEEARLLGLTDEKIYDYLQVEWISKNAHDSLARKLGVKVAKST